MEKQISLEGALLNISNTLDSVKGNIQLIVGSLNKQLDEAQKRIKELEEVAKTEKPKEEKKDK